MGNTDKRGILEEEVFTYKTNKEKSKVTIYWHDTQATILRGDKATTFLRKLEPLERKKAQLLMAKITGNFKRGNERNYGPKSNRR